MKKRFFACAILALCIALVGQGTLAYFTSRSTATNVITAGNISIELVEEGQKPDGTWDDFDKVHKGSHVDGVMPGMDVAKRVYVTNTGDFPAYVRVKVDQAVELADAAAVEQQGAVTIDFNTTDWTLKDGYYYYNKALAPKGSEGSATEYLFEKVTFNGLMDNRYQNAEIKVDVTAYATQVANNGSTALEAAGWPG